MVGSSLASVSLLPTSGPIFLLLLTLLSLHVYCAHSYPSSISSELEDPQVIVLSVHSKTEVTHRASEEKEGIMGSQGI